MAGASTFRGKDGLFLLLTYGLLCLLAVIPALLNGYALVFSDSDNYIAADLFPGRPPFYGWFVAASSLGASLNWTLLAQSLLCAFVVITILRRAGALTAWRLTLAGVAVMGANQLPWLASWLMPDFLAGLGGAALIAMVLVPLRPLETLALSAVAILAATSASANAPLYAGLLAVLGVGGLVLRGGVRPRPYLAACASVAAAALLLIGANGVLFGKPGLNAADGTMMYGRLANIGLAYEPTAQACRTRTYAICGHLEALRTAPYRGQTFLWGGIANATQAWELNESQYDDLADIVLKARWKAFARISAAEDLVMMLKRPALTESQDFMPRTGPESDVTGSIRTHFPNGLDAYLNARQARNQVARLFPSTVYNLGAFASYLVLGALGALAWRRGDRAAVLMAAAVFAFIAGELVLHSVLVGGYSRYHAKVAWLGGLLAVVLACRLWPGLAGARPAPAQPA